MRDDLIDQAADITTVSVGVVDQNAQRQWWMVGWIEVAAEGVGVAEGAGFAPESAFGIGAAHPIA